jgi:hypothetical protein
MVTPVKYRSPGALLPIEWLVKTQSRDLRRWVWNHNEFPDQDYLCLPASLRGTNCVLILGRDTA